LKEFTDFSGLADPEDEGSMILWITGIWLPCAAASYPRRMESWGKDFLPIIFLLWDDKHKTQNAGNCWPEKPKIQFYSLPLKHGVWVCR